MNIEETDIQNFFRQNAPEIKDDESFMIELSARMDAVREIKEMQKSVLKRMRIECIAVLVAGIVAGGLCVALLLLHPVSPLHLRMGIMAGLAAFIAEWKDVLIVMAALCSLILGLIPWEKVSTWRLP